MTPKQMLISAAGLVIFGLLVLVTRNMQELNKTSQDQKAMYNDLQQQEIGQ
jgi:Flp pilus assembly protein CpaB